MDKQKRNWIIFFVIVALVAGYIVVRIILNSETYLEWKIQQVKEDIRELIAEDASQWQAAAETARKEAQTSGMDLYKYRHQSTFSQELDDHLNKLIQSSSVKFDWVRAMQDRASYPDDCCSFEYTIEYFRGVYAWVRLVYVPASDQRNPQWYQEYSRMPEKIGDNWYIIVRYGY